MPHHTPCRLLMLAACTSAATAAAAAAQNSRQLPAPASIMVGGDTARLGAAVTGLDNNARYVRVVLRVPARAEIYAVNRSNEMHVMASCYLDSGTTTIRPTLTETQSDSAAFQMGSSFGNNSRQRAPTRSLSVWRFAASQEQLLIVLMAEQPTSRRNCDNSGNGSLLNVARMPPAEALESFPTSLLRYPDTRWASFLVQP